MKLRIYNKTLDPKFWNDDKTLKPEVREHLLKIAEDFYNSTDLDGEVHNILFIGSMANYNWTPSSDADVHIVIDISSEKINEEYARKFMDNLSFKWNTEHDIEIKGHPVEVYLQDIREPNADATKGRPGTAIYSIFDGKWLIEPKHEVPKIDADKVRQKYQVIKNKVKSLIQTEDITRLKELMKSIRNYRDAGLSKGGEFSVENLVFKALRKGGDLEKIKTAINSIYDKKASLPEHGNMQPSTSTNKMNESLLNKTKPYLIFGYIDSDFHINSKFDYGAEDKSASLGHGDLDDYGTGENTQKRWRYSSIRNTIYWLDEDTPNEMEKEEVTNYLDKKYAIVKPIHKVSIHGYFTHGHYINEELLDKTKPYHIIGTVDPNLQIRSLVDYSEMKGHNDIDFKWRYHRRWRYNSIRNTVYWIDEEAPNDEEKHAVENYLDKKYAIIDPKQEVSVMGYFKYGHKLAEGKGDKSFTLVGVVNDDLDVQSIVDYNNLLGHCNMPYRISDSRWRYNSKRNTVYWTNSEMPTEQQKNSVDIHLDKKYGIINSKHEISDKYFTHGHYINEHLVSKKANLYLGFVNRENFKVIGRDIEDEDETHGDFSRSLPTELRWRFGSESLLWRYKRSTNTVYWWSVYESPNDEEKQAVGDWLFQNANIKYPEHKMISWDRDAISTANRIAAHTTGDEGEYTGFID